MLYIYHHFIIPEERVVHAQCDVVGKHPVVIYRSEGSRIFLSLFYGNDDLDPSTSINSTI